MSSETASAPKTWRGRFYEDFEVGDTFRSRIGRTITETDNIWFTCLTMNTNQIHFNTPYAERTQFGKPLVNSTFTLALITGMTVPDTSENAAANLQWTDIKLPKPVFAGDTLWAESEILELRESKSNPSVGIVSMRCRGVNQRREAAPAFPGTDIDWSVS
jgi:acyl dehydratase